MADRLSTGSQRDEIYNELPVTRRCSFAKFSNEKQVLFGRNESRPHNYLIARETSVSQETDCTHPLGEPEKRMSTSGDDDTTSSIDKCDGTRKLGHAGAMKNLFVLGFSFMLWLTCFSSLQNLQSTMNPHQGGIGVVSLACLYSATLLSCLVAPSFIRLLSAKWTTVAAYSIFLVYISANFYPADYFLIPASLLFGCLAGPLWTAQSTYLTALAMQYARSTRELPESSVIRFNGIFGGLLQTSQVWGNLLTSAILSSDNDTVNLERRNTSCTRTFCGAKDCSRDDSHAGYPYDSVPHFAAPLPNSARYLLLSVETLFVVIAILAQTFLLDRRLDSGDDNDMFQLESSRHWEKGPAGGLNTRQLMTSTALLMTDPRLQLLLPLVLFTGFQEGFVISTFTKSYVNCALGIHQVGYILICFSSVNALTCLVIGHVAKHIKRKYIVAFCAMFDAGTLLVLACWGPTHEDLPMFYVVSSCLGLSDAIWMTQTNAMFGLFFSDNTEAAFSCYRSAQTIGLIIAFVCGRFVCVYSTVYAMGASLVIGVVFYAAAEYSLHRLVRFRDGGVIVVL